MVMKKDCRDCKNFKNCSLKKQKEESLGLGENVEYSCKEWEEK